MNYVILAITPASGCTEKKTVKLSRHRAISAPTLEPLFGNKIICDINKNVVVLTVIV